MAISATYVNAAQFTVAGDHEDAFPVNRCVELQMGGDGTIYGIVQASQYNGGTGLTTVTTAFLGSDVITSNLANVELSEGGFGGTAAQGVQGNAGDHFHTTKKGDGGHLDAADLSAAQALNAQRLPTPDGIYEDLFFLRYEHGTETFELVEVVGSANQVLGTNAAGDDIENKTLSGTANQVIITPTVGGFTFSLPQSIATASSPVFQGMTFPGLAGILVSDGVYGIDDVAFGSALQLLRMDSGGSGLEFVSPSLSILSDVDLSSIAEGDLWQYDGSKFIRVNCSGASTGDVATYNATTKRWAPAAPAGGSGGGANMGIVVSNSVFGNF